MGDGWGRVVRALCAGLLVCFCAPAAASPSHCEPWAGEPSPLPTVASRDDALSRWAELRVAELVERAQLAEAGDPLESHRLWRRVLCLDPVNPLAWRGLDRTRAVRVYRPTVEWIEREEARRPRATADPWDDLAAPVQVTRARRPTRARVAETRPAADPAPAPKPAIDPRMAERAEAVRRASGLVDDGEESLRAARFEEALGRALAARKALEGLDRHPEVEPLRARGEVLAGTAQVALGDDAGAQESFERALTADPSLRLDPLTTSPKVLHVLEAARASGAGGSP